MPEILNGLLSGKYDSTKQRAVLLNSERFRNYWIYTATMRMELLLTGRLIFTDAQFFDSLYFHWLTGSTQKIRPIDGTGGSVKIDGIDAYIADMKKILKSQYGERSSVIENREKCLPLAGILRGFGMS